MKARSPLDWDDFWLGKKAKIEFEFFEIGKLVEVLLTLNLPPNKQAHFVIGDK